MNLFLPVLSAACGRCRTACPSVCVSGGEQGFVKTFTAWQKLASGTGGYVFGRITAVSGALYSVENNGTSADWTATLFYRENNASIFDSSYKKCYNKCNDDNKKAISHQSPKFALYGVFPL